MKKYILFSLTFLLSLSLWASNDVITPSNTFIHENFPTKYVNKSDRDSFLLYYVRTNPIKKNTFDSLIVKKNYRVHHKIWKTINKQRVFQRVSAVFEDNYRVDTLLIFNQKCEKKNGDKYVETKYYIIGKFEQYRHSYYKQSDESNITSPYDVPLSSNLNRRKCSPHHKEEISKNFFEFIRKINHKWIVVEKTSDNVKKVSEPSLFDYLLPYSLSLLSSSTSSTPSTSSTLSSKEDNIKRVVNFVRFLIDKPWGCLDDKDIKKSQFKQSIIEKNYFKNLENDWDEFDINKNNNVYVDGRGYEPISGYYLLTPQELRVNDIHILPTVKFAGEKLIAYNYSIYLSERYDMNDANMVMSSIAQNLGFKKTGKFKTYTDLGYILRGSCLYGKYKDSKIFISEPDKISDYIIKIYIIKDKRQSLIQ